MTKASQNHIAYNLISRCIAAHIADPEINIFNFDDDDALWLAQRLVKVMPNDIAPELAARVAVNTVLNGGVVDLDAIQFSDTHLSISTEARTDDLNIDPRLTAIVGLQNAVLLALDPILNKLPKEQAEAVRSSFYAAVSKYDPPNTLMSIISGSLFHKLISDMLTSLLDNKVQMLSTNQPGGFNATVIDTIKKLRWPGRNVGSPYYDLNQYFFHDEKVSEEQADQVVDNLLMRYILGCCDIPNINIFAQTPALVFPVAKALYVGLVSHWGKNQAVKIAVNFAMNGNHVNLDKIEPLNAGVTVPDNMSTMDKHVALDLTVRRLSQTVQLTLCPVTMRLSKKAYDQFGKDIDTFADAIIKETRLDILGTTDVVDQLTEACVRELAKYGIMRVPPVGFPIVDDVVINGIIARSWPGAAMPTNDYILGRFSFPQPYQQPQVNSMHRYNAMYAPNNLAFDQNRFARFDAYRQHVQNDPFNPNNRPPVAPSGPFAGLDPVSAYAQAQGNRCACGMCLVPSDGRPDFVNLGQSFPWHQPMQQPQFGNPPLMKPWPMQQVMHPQFGEPVRYGKVGTFVPSPEAESDEKDTTAAGTQVTHHDFADYVEQLDFLISAGKFEISDDTRSMLVRNWVIQHNYMPEMHRFLTPLGGYDSDPAASVTPLPREAGDQKPVI